jgi:hypothetical protein
MGNARYPPTFNDLIARCLKGAAMELLVTSIHDTPVDRGTQWAVVWVIAFPDDLLRAAFDFTDIWRKLATKTSFTSLWVNAAY